VGLDVVGSVEFGDFFEEVEVGVEEEVEFGCEVVDVEVV